MGVALLPFLSSERLQSLFNFTSGTGFLRLNLWRSSLQMALDNPWVGAGPDNFLYLYRSGYILPQAWMEPNLNHPHNFVLDWWTRLGVPGLVVGLTFWGVLLASLLRRMLHATHQRESWPALYLGLVAAVVASLAHGLIDASFALPDLMAIWALLTVLATVESPQSLPRA
jgi:O-antigen ligase